MNPENTQEVAPEPPASTPATPTYIGNTNIIDRSNKSAASVIPTPIPANPSDTSGTDEQFKQAASSFSAAIVLVCGFGSSAAWSLAAYLSHSITIAMVVAGLLAAVAIFFAVKEYGATQKLGPLSIIGLSGATFALVMISDYWLARLLIHSAFSGLTF